MSRSLERVYTAAADIARLEALVTQLVSNARVLVELDDGQALRGIVAEQPSVQTFYDHDGHEGLNGLVRMELPRAGSFDASDSVDLELGHIRAVRPLAPSEFGTRLNRAPGRPR